MILIAYQNDSQGGDSTILAQVTTSNNYKTKLKPRIQIQIEFANFNKITCCTKHRSQNRGDCLTSKIEFETIKAVEKSKNTTAVNHTRFKLNEEL